MSSRPVPLPLVADSTRLRILLRLERLGPASLDELAAAAGVHLNTVRAHLAPLGEAGLVERQHVQRKARGRPALRYSLAPGWRVDAPDLTGLTELLAATVATLDPKPGQLQAIGQGWGRWLAGRPGNEELVDLVPSSLAALGFEAEVQDAAVTLTGCPCAQVLPGRPEILCRLAAAVVDGVAAASSDGRGVQDSIHDPVARRCRLVLGDRPSRRVLPLRLRRPS